MRLFHKFNHDYLVITLGLINLLGGFLGYSYWFLQVLILTCIINLNIIRSGGKLKLWASFGFYFFFAISVLSSWSDGSQNYISPFYFTVLPAAILGYLTAVLLNSTEWIEKKLIYFFSAILLFFTFHIFSLLFVLKSLAQEEIVILSDEITLESGINYIWGTNCGSCIKTIRDNEEFFNSSDVSVYLSYQSTTDSILGRKLLSQNTTYEINNLGYIKNANLTEKGILGYPIVEIYEHGKIVYQGPFFSRWFIPNRLTVLILTLKM